MKVAGVELFTHNLPGIRLFIQHRCVTHLYVQILYGAFTAAKVYGYNAVTGVLSLFKFPLFLKLQNKKF